VEAMGRGVPVVSTSVVGIPELVIHRKTGLLVAPDDPQELAAAILELRSDRSLAHFLATAGRNHVAAAYDPVGAAHALVQVWRDVRTGTVVST
jgi:colanic acid/amylovoran biosynthesis glycosyltransferase